MTRIFRWSQSSSPCAAATLSVVLFALIGCGSVPFGPVGSPFDHTTYPGSAISGLVHGGQQPVTGATLQLYAAGTPSAPASGGVIGGFGQGATALLTPGSMTVGSANNYWPTSSSNSGATCTYTTGNTNACTILPQTDSYGGFSVTSDYTCPSAGAQIYLVATGGNPGLTGSVNNAYIAMMAALGSCSGLSGSTYLTIDEVTTVGAVWALQQFMSAPTGAAASTYTSQGGSTTGVGVKIGASSGPVSGYGHNHVQTQQIGLVNAFGMVGNIVSNSAGTATPDNSWSTTYTAKVNALANILAACVNTDGVTSNVCSTLMSDATVSGTTAPQDTIQAAWMMAQNPAHNASTLIALATSTPPFAPTLASTTANLDLTLEVGFTPTFASGTFSGSNAVYGASELVIDASGRPWVYSSAGSGVAGLSTPFIAEIAANGSSALAGPFQTFTASGGNTGGTNTCAANQVHTLGNATYQMAIDQNSNLWASSSETKPSCTTNYTVMIIDTDTATVSSGVYAATSGSQGIAVDASNNIWTQGATSHFVSFTNGTSTYKASIGSGIGSAVAVATDTASTPSVWMVAPTACTASGVAGTGGLLYQLHTSSINLTGSALDAEFQGFYTSGDVCSANATVSMTAALNQVQSLAVDANNGIWAVNYAPTGTNSVTYLAPQSSAWSSAVSGSTTIPLTGAYTTASGFGGMTNPIGVAVDGANHAWIANNAKVTGYGDSISELSVTLQSGTNNIVSINNLANTTGFIFPNTSLPFDHLAKALAIDPSGNIWLTSGSTYTQLTVMVGAATPVVTPIAYQVEYGLLGAPPQ